MNTGNTSIKIITDLIQKICDNHLQINNTYFGEEYNKEDGNMLYPAVFFNYVSTDMSSSSDIYRTKDYTFNIKVLDIVNEAEDNETDVKSDTEQILSDIIYYFSSNADILKAKIKLVGSVFITPLKQKYDQGTYGVESNLTIRVPYTLSCIDIPEKSTLVI